MTNLANFIAARFGTPAARSPYGAFSQCTFVTLQNNLVVGYATGVVGNQPGRTTMEGELRHYFSDRVSDNPATIQRESYPFNPNATDRTGIRLDVVSPEQLSITLTALSWGSGQSTLTVVGCTADVLICTGPGAGAHIPTAMYLLTLGLPVATPG